MTPILIAQLPSPPGKNVFREWAGGMGTALGSDRVGYGHDQKFYEVPFSSYLYVAARLRDQGIAFAYHDFQAAAALTLAEFDQVFTGLAPRLVLSQVNLPSLEHDLLLLARIRAAAPDVVIVLVGATAKWFQERLLRDGHADAVMTESEELLTASTMVALLDGDADGLQGCSVWRDGKVASYPAQQTMTTLDFVRFPAYDLLDFTRYESDYYLDTTYRYATVFTTKGCPYKCGYCPYPFGFGKRLVYRSPQVVADDIARLKHEFGVGQILFRDQVFSVNRKHAVAVCEALIERDLQIVWVCETRYDVVDEELLRLMYRAGCREVHFGLESGDPAMFASVAKSDGPRSLPLFASVVAQARAVGMRVHLHCIVGMPDESWMSVRNTTRFLRQVRPDSVQLAYFVPYPGTPLFDELSKSGELGDLNALQWEDLGSFTGPVLPTRHMTVAEVTRARNRIAVDWQHTLSDRVWMKMRSVLRLPRAA